MIILDGHESQLKPSFLNYIHGVNTKWKVCFGIPYGTSYWQVGDAPEQNGSFKMAWVRAKHYLISFKQDCGLKLTLAYP